MTGLTEGCYTESEDECQGCEFRFTCQTFMTTNIDEEVLGED